MNPATQSALQPLQDTLSATSAVTRRSSVALPLGRPVSRISGGTAHGRDYGRSDRGSRPRYAMSEAESASQVSHLWRRNTVNAPEKDHRWDGGWRSIRKTASRQDHGRLLACIAKLDEMPQPDPCRRTYILGDCRASAFAQASCQNVNQNANPAGPRSFGESSFVTTVRLLKPSVMHSSTLAQCQNLCLPARIQSAHAPDTFEVTHVHPATPSSTTPADSQARAS
jgi:hypothetical protein